MKIINNKISKLTQSLMLLLFTAGIISIAAIDSQLSASEQVKKTTSDRASDLSKKTPKKKSAKSSSILKKEISELKVIVEKLCSNEFEGRGAATKGIEKAREYIGQQFKEIGLKKIKNGTYNHNFNFCFGEKISSENVELYIPNSENIITLGKKDFTIVASAGGSRFDLSLAFAGYGIINPKKKYNSYSSVDPGDLKDKAVIIFRGEPVNKKNKSKWRTGKYRWSRSASLMRKMSHAKKAGASAIIIIEPPRLKFGVKYYEGFLSPRYTKRFGKIPVLKLDYNFFLRILKSNGYANPKKKGLELRKLADRGKTTVIDLGKVKIKGEISSSPKKYSVHNVVGILPGKGKLAKEIVVIGGHYDHLGYGIVPNSTRDKRIDGKYYPGADDNASGIAAMLLSAKKISKFYKESALENCRTIVFVGFAGEECGLWGSQKFLSDMKKIGFDKTKISAMINLDMVGVMRNSRLCMIGQTTGLEFMTYISEANKSSKKNLKLTSINVPFAFSDHATFISKKIPAIMFTTGLHSFYHQRADKPDKLNYKGLHSVAQIVTNLAIKISTAKEKVSFNAYSKHGKIYLGLRLDRKKYQKICKISRIVPGGPAQKAGLRNGDIIVGLDNHSIENKKSLLKALRNYKSEDSVKVTVIRNRKKIERILILGKR